MKTLNQIKTICVIASCVLASNLNAQDTNVDWETASDDQVILQAIELTTPIPSNEVPAFATFYSAQHSPISAQPWPPLPADIEHFNGWDLGSNVWVLDDLDFDYSAPTVQANHSMMAMDDDGGINPPGGGGTNIYYPAGSSYSFDPGTNLWIAQEAVSGGNFSGIVSNTIPDVEYQLLYANSLNPPVQWQLVPNGTFYGSDETNWASWSIPFDSTTNFFLNVLSDQSDGSGLPYWWELKYYGQDTNVDPYADPEGDGYDNLELYQMGVNPFSWITPPAPQGLAALYNANNGNVAVSWEPSSGPVTGYILVGPNGTNYLSSGATTYNDNVSSIQGDYTNDINDWGPTLFYTYQIQATYSGGDSAWSNPVWMQSDPALTSQSPPLAIFCYLVPGPQGSLYLAAPALPPGTAGLNVMRVDLGAYYLNGAYDGNLPIETNFDIPVNSSTPGLFLIPSQWNQMQPDAYNYNWYAWWVQVVSSNGDESLADPIAVNGYQYFEETNLFQWLVPPYFDGRAQLKQNLEFLFRGATVSSPFQCIENGNYYNPYYPDVVTFTNPPTYEYAGFYQQGASSEHGFSFQSGAQFDPYWPFENNYRYQNFVLTPTDESTNGQIMTGIGINGWDPYNNLDPQGIYFDYPPTNQFYPADVTVPAGLQQASEPFLASYPEQPTYGAAQTNDIWYDLSDIGVLYTFNQDTYQQIFDAEKTANYFGLPLESVDIADEQTDANGNLLGTYNTVVLAGNNVQAYWQGTPYVYPEFAGPQFQTVEYDFWQNPDPSVLPGGNAFSVTHTNLPLIAGVGSPGFQAVAYAKLAVTNSIYPGVYGFLGQYFTNAYQIDDSGNVTPKTTGLLSPYGNFFATEPGEAALVTMPDVDTGQQGTDIVYCISLALDKNHDGTIDTSFSGPDTTSASSPYVFWCNNNYDRWAYPLDSDPYQDEVLNSDAENPYQEDDEFTRFGQRNIPDTRDLEDFARLWVCGVNSNLLAALPPGSTITLNWGDVNNPSTNNPTIDLFEAANPDGGIGYLTNEMTATNQIDIDARPYVGRLGPGDSIQLNATNFLNNWAGNYFIWCGVNYGSGGLNLTIATSNGTVIAQTTTYIQITDIKQMYERWTVGNDPGRMPKTTAILEREALPFPGQPAFQYPAPQGTNTPYILYVHGWNESDDMKDAHAQTAFKRLYWQGYQGRFGFFRWPTTSGETATALADGTEGVEDDYNWSENLAWYSAAGLLNLLTNLDAEYNGQVYLFAHSLGNVVAGEAFRLAGSNQVVNVYVASQAALTAHLYDSTVPDTIFSTTVTPEIFNNWLADINGNGAGKVISFYNTNDAALGPEYWEKDQSAKPSQSEYVHGGPWAFYGTPYTEDSPLYTPGSVDDSYPWKGFQGFDITPNIAASVTNYYIVAAWASQPRATALGRTAVVHNILDVDLTLPDNGIWPPDTHSPFSYRDILWHSGEFLDDTPEQQGYWSYLLGPKAFNLESQ
ncbi:MAG TPA: alpha/beta hydrolase [Candidatus Sulfotelmatobacter sp.]|nr:alpha/beta hydrolase [Candidatus Sulfotelmatobacter sp.]